ncbi:hypothetical protein GF385_04570 [Candidatus Dependentiae bacterium]|nr:hypothetical protein [Candidatus Dependentiae bacterium]
MFFLNTGYPFLNPIIPLARYKLFLIIFSFFIGQNTKLKESKKFYDKNKIIYLKPVIKSFNNKYNSITTGQLIYHQLSKLKLERETKKIILLAPETYFPFSLNKNKNMVKLWNNVLTNNTHLILGSQREERGNVNKKIFQTVFVLNRGRIIDFYDKTHRVIFAEKIPYVLKNSKWSRSLFLNGKNEYFKGKQKSKKFKLNNFIICPKICSEFFYKIDLHKEINSDCVFLFVNDSWFMPYFRRILQNITKIYSIRLNLPIFYIGHFKLKLFNQ